MGLIEWLDKKLALRDDMKVSDKSALIEEMEESMKKKREKDLKW